MPSDALVPTGGKHSGTVPDKYSGIRLGLDKTLAILQHYDHGLSVRAISEAVHSDVRTIGGVLRQYRDRPVSARQLLTQSAVLAASKWVTAMDKASASGNHGPMKDLLLHVGAIQPAYGPGAARPTQVAVQVVIGTPTAPIDHDPLKPR